MDSIVVDTDVVSFIAKGTSAPPVTLAIMLKGETRGIPSVQFIILLLLPSCRLSHFVTICHTAPPGGVAQFFLLLIE